MELTLDFDISFKLLAAINEIIESDSDNENGESLIAIKTLGEGSLETVKDKTQQFFDGMVIESDPKHPGKMIKLLELIKSYVSSGGSIVQAS